MTTSTLGTPMNDTKTDTRTIAVTGASGLVGTRLCKELSGPETQILRLVRRPPQTYESELLWDPDKGEINAERLSGVDAVVHLAGENIAGGRWNAERKRRIRESRVRGTTFLAETLAVGFPEGDVSRNLAVAVEEL